MARIFGITLFGLWCFSTPLLLAKGIVVRPSQVEIEVAQGQSGSARLLVSGTSAEKTRVRIRVEDFVLDEAGLPERSEGISGSRSAAAGLLVDPVELTVAGTERQTVLLHLTLPPGASGSYWALLVFDVEGTEAVDSDGNPVRIGSRLLVPVVGTVAGRGRRDLRVTDLQAEWQPSGECAIQMTVENHGDTALRPSPGWVLFRRLADGQTEELTHGQGLEFLLLPDRRRIIRDALPCGAAGVDGLGLYGFVRHARDSRERVERTVSLSLPPVAR